MIIAEALSGHGELPMAIRNITEVIRPKLQDFWQFQITHFKRQGNHLAWLKGIEFLGIPFWLESQSGGLIDNVSPFGPRNV